MADRNANDLSLDPQAEEKKLDFLDPVVNSADPKQLRKKAISDKNRELQDEADLRTVLGTPAGVRFVARIVGGPCGWGYPHFNPSNSIMSETAGRRSVGWQIEQWVRDADLSFWHQVDRELNELRAKPKKG